MTAPLNLDVFPSPTNFHIFRDEPDTGPRPALLADDGSTLLADDGGTLTSD